jgi:hypothetical protein
MDAVARAVARRFSMSRVSDSDPEIAAVGALHVSSCDRTELLRPPEIHELGRVWLCPKLLTSIRVSARETCVCVSSIGPAGCQRRQCPDHLTI